MPQDSRPRKPSARPRSARLAPAAREAQIVEVASAIFEVEPYEAVTLEGIARAAEVSPALVHHYFGSKQGLFLAVVKRTSDDFLRALLPDGTAGRPSTPREALRGALERHVRFVKVRPNGYAFVIGARGAPGPEVQRHISAQRELAHRTVLALLGIEHPNAQQQLEVWGWIGALEAIVTRWLREPGELSDEQLVELALDQLPLL